jgi:hypothetical protein
MSTVGIRTMDILEICAYFALALGVIPNPMGYVVIAVCRVVQLFL